jgi:predicted SAM-dependent methyltransferase
MLRFLQEQARVACVLGIGKSRPSFWRRSTAAETRVRDEYLLPALRGMSSASIDVIYSRHVLEQHSIEAGVLLKDPEFKRAIKDNRFDDLPETFPASPRNIQAVLKECMRILRPGGAMITQIAKKKYGVLTTEKLQTFQPDKLSHRELGRLSEIWTLVK